MVYMAYHGIGIMGRMMGSAAKSAEMGSFMSLVYNIYFEVASAVFLVILYIFMKLQYNVQSGINREFRRLTLLVLLANVMDVVTAVTISYAAVLAVWVNLVLNTAYFAADAFVGYQFMYYSRLCVDRKNGKSRMLFINRILLCVYLGMLAVNLWAGCIFFHRRGRGVHTWRNVSHGVSGALLPDSVFCICPPMPFPIVSEMAAGLYRALSGIEFYRADPTASAVSGGASGIVFPPRWRL